MTGNTHDTGYTSDDDGFATMHARYGGGWDDETDMRDRVVHVDVDTYEEAPRVEKIRRHARLRADTLPHAPGAHWQDVPCLCDCHFGKVTRDGAPACDDRDCRKGGETRARYYAREQERKQARHAKRQQQQVGA